MSSATILFILQRILADETLADGARVAGLCFGPGLTVETARLTLRTADAVGEPAGTVAATPETVAEVPEPRREPV
jgi:hypothetical protein